MKQKFKETEIGTIPNDWKATELGKHVIKIGSGITPRGGKSVYLSNGVVLIRSQNVYNSGFSEDGIVHITDETAKMMNNVEVQETDVLLNITGDSVARCCTAPKQILPARVNQHVLIIRTSPELDYLFLRYYLINQPTQNMLLSLADSGGTRQALTKEMVESLPIPFPSIREQKAIAKILYDIDTKIKLNQQMNQNLEAIGHARFRHWFIDFEFPNEKGMPYKTSGGEFISSELGAIPKDWKVKDVYSFADIINGAPFTSGQFNQSGVGLPLIRIRDLKTSTPQFYTNERHPKATVIEPGDIIVGMDAEFRPTIWTGEQAYLNQRLFLAKPKKTTAHFYVYESLKPRLMFFENSKVGTTVIHLSKTDIDSFRFSSPPDNIESQFKQFIDPLYNKMILNAQQCTELSKLRDGLLPKLMSGKIRVPV